MGQKWAKKMKKSGCRRPAAAERQARVRWVRSLLTANFEGNLNPEGMYRFKGTTDRNAPAHYVLKRRTVWILEGLAGSGLRPDI